MACGQCSSGGCGSIIKSAEEKTNHKTVGGCSSGSCGTGGCNKMNAFDWLSNMDTPLSSRYDVIEVKFKGGRKEFFRNKNGLELFTGDFVVCEMPTGYHIGSVSLQGELVRLQMIKKNIKDDKEIATLHRVATEKDLEKHTQAINRDLVAMFKTRQICSELKLKLKLSEVEFQSDNSKATFYYSAEDRVDFRDLIKRLATEFKVRVEMRQISLRQEAGRLGGIGSCGRELCCSTWITDFKAIPTAAARYQNLSLNPAKLSGQCGRLKCCLNYELETYIDAIRDMPVVDRPLKTEKGDAMLQKTDIFRRIMWFSYPNESNWLPINAEQVVEIQKMNKEGKKPVALENLMQIQELEQSKPTSINTDLDKLDQKYQTKRKSSRNKKSKPRANNDNISSDSAAASTENSNNNPRSNNNAKPNNPRSGNNPRSNNNRNTPRTENSPRPANSPKITGNTHTEKAATPITGNTTPNAGGAAPNEGQNPVNKNKKRRNKNRNRPPRDNNNNTPS